MSIYTTVRRLLKKRESEEADTHDEYIEEDDISIEGANDISIEEADDEYVLLKAFVQENPEVGFSYAINRIDELKVAAASLIKEKDATERVNTSLKEDLEKTFQFKSQLEDLKEELMIRERDISEKSIEIETLVRKTAKLSVETDALKNKIEKKDQQIKNYLNQMEELRQDSKIVDLEKDIRGLRAVLEEKEDALTLRNTELEDLKRLTALNEEELSDLKSKWRQADEQARKLTAELQEKKGVVASRDSLVRGFSKKIKDLASRVDKMKAELEDRDKKIEDFDNRLGGIEARLFGLKTAIGLDDSSREKIARKLFGEKEEFTLEDEIDIIIEKIGEKEGDFLYQEMDESLNAKVTEIEELKKPIKEVTPAHKEEKEKPKAPSNEGKKRILNIEKRSAEKTLKSLLAGHTNVAERRVKEKIYRKKIEDINKKIRELEQD